MAPSANANAPMRACGPAALLPAVLDACVAMHAIAPERPERACAPPLGRWNGGAFGLLPSIIFSSFLLLLGSGSVGGADTSHISSGSRRASRLVGAIVPRALLARARFFLCGAKGNARRLERAYTTTRATPTSCEPRNRAARSAGSLPTSPAAGPHRYSEAEHNATISTTMNMSERRINAVCVQAVEPSIAFYRWLAGARSAARMSCVVRTAWSIGGARSRVVVVALGARCECGGLLQSHLACFLIRLL